MVIKLFVVREVQRETKIVSLSVNMRSVKGCSDCQKTVPIAEHFFCYNTYTAILFSEHYYDNRYKSQEELH